EGKLVSSVDHAQIIVEAVSMGVVLVVADIVAGKSKSAGDAEAGVCRCVATVSFDADVAIRKVGIADPPDIDDVGAGPERLDDAGTDQIRVTESDRFRRAVVADGAGSQYIFRGEIIRRRIVQRVPHETGED